MHHKNTAIIEACRGPGNLFPFSYLFIPMLVSVVLYSADILAIDDKHQPYPSGSVYNLNRLLPWSEETDDLVRYPIGCSVNTIADFSLQALFPESQGSFSEVFHRQCERHDLCYRHGYYTYQFSKDDCDDEFASGLTQQCLRKFSGEERSQCLRVAGILSLAARKFGHLSYHADDYPFRDYGYYYEYLTDRPGRYALFWAMLDPNAKQAQRLYQAKFNPRSPLPDRSRTHVLLVDFFRKKSDLEQLMYRLRKTDRQGKAK